MVRTLLTLFILMNACSYLGAQDVFWFEDFDDGAASRWNVSGNEPTPLGITGLTYGSNGNFDYFVINDANTPELDAPITTGISLADQGQFVRGRHYDCAAPNDLPNPFVNTGAVNNSLHITAQTGCSGLLYAGTPGYDDWNCITISGNDAVLTETEQYAAYQSNIDATGRCNIKLTADFYIGGSANGQEAHSTILYSIDGGANWAIVEDNLASCFHTVAGTCNDWQRRSFELPADADNQPDLRIAFRWVEDGNTNNNTQDYALGASFNVDNVMLSSCNKPNADFTVDQTNVCKNQTVSLNSIITSTASIYMDCGSVLTDNCTVSYFWNIPGATFVNGTNATDANPQIQFSTNGNYTIELVASTCGGDSTVTKINLITVADCPPDANFTTTKFTVCADPVASLDTLIFTDLSTTPTVPITAWNWSFSPATVSFVNGTTANDPNPEVTFDAPGTYQVSLQVTSAEGSDTEIKTAYIEAISCECVSSGGGSPTVIWSEDFDGNGGAGSNWGTLNQDIGTQGITANLWYISGQECGNAAGACGTVCAGIDQSLHVSSSSLGDIGAAYDASSLCLPGCFACDFFPAFCSDVNTNRRSQSQNINTVGQTGLTLDFNYIEDGQGTFDDCILEYSTDGGVSWTPLINTAKTPLGACAPQATWTAFSIPLPAACENIPNLRIGFRWQNNADGVGTDPSFGVDDITITATSGGVGLPSTWEGTASNDWHTAANWSTAAVPTNADDVLVPNAADLVGTFMPTIAAPANARNVCNFGSISLTANQTLTIEEELLNEGDISTDNVDAQPDVIFVNTASTYRGNGTMFDVDVEVASSDFILLSDLNTRSFQINTTGTVDLGIFTLSINKNLIKTAGILIANNAEVHFIEACPTCVDNTSNADVTLDANQVFGNVLVDKPVGVRVSLLSAVDHTLLAPATLTIQEGILDANAQTLNGTGNLTMTGGELQLAKNAVALPELTGVYTLTAGQITLDGDAQIIKSRSDAGADYYDLAFAGTGIKTLSSDNVYVNNRLFLNLPTGLGNYINTVTDTLFVQNPNTNALVHTGGHVVGYLGRVVNPSDAYFYPVGSDNAGGDTYYEPVELTTNSLTGPTILTARFFDNVPNPTTVNNVTFMTTFGALDTIRAVEEEGYWHFANNQPIVGGNYQVSVSPSNFWTFTQPWAQGYYALLKQDAVGLPWDFINGGLRVNDSTTRAFSDFSNYALAYTDSIIPTTILDVEWLTFEGEKTTEGNQLYWETTSSSQAVYFVLERSPNGLDFVPIANLEANILHHYDYVDQTPLSGWNYYRVKAVEADGTIHYSKMVALDYNKVNPKIRLYPNPANDHLTFDYQRPNTDAAVQVEIININGQVVWSAAFASSANMQETISLKGLTQGVYVIQFTNGDMRQTRRFVRIE